MWNDIALRATRDVQAVFGEDVTYAQAGSDSVTIRGVFEEKHKAVDPDTGVPFYSTYPVLEVVNADLPPGSPQPHDTVVIRGTTYRVVGGEPDDTGTTLLELKT